MPGLDGGDAMDEVGGHEEGVAGDQALRLSVDGDVEDAALDIGCLAMRVLVRLADRAGLEDDAHDHQIRPIGHDLALDAGLGRLPGEIGVVLEIKHATYFSGLGYDVAGADTVAAAKDEIDSATARLRATQREGSFGIQFGAEGDPMPWGNAVIGVRNPTSPPVVIRRVTDVTGESVTSDFYLGAEFGIASLLQAPSFIYRSTVGEPDPDVR